MDLGFFRRERPQPTDRLLVELDYGALVAALQAYQASSVTARAQAVAPVSSEKPCRAHAALVELLVGGPGWRAALEEQSGSFNAKYARYRGTNT